MEPYDEDLAAERRGASLLVIGEKLAGWDRSEVAAKLAPVTSAAGPDAVSRLAHLEGLVRSLRAGVMTTGEPAEELVVAVAAEATAWHCALHDSGRPE